MNQALSLLGQAFDRVPVNLWYGLVICSAAVGVFLTGIALGLDMALEEHPYFAPASQLDEVVAVTWGCIVILGISSVSLFAAGVRKSLRQSGEQPAGEC